MMTNLDFFSDPNGTTGQACHPDGLTRETITAMQRDINRNLRHEGYPVRYGQRPATVRGPVSSGTEPTIGPASAANTPSPGSCASPLLATRAQPGGTGAADDAGPSAGEPAGDPVPTLFTPTQAAELLQVRESWLRRRAARRQVPGTFLGKHLRFSPANLKQIITDAARPAATNQRTAPNASTAPRRRGRPPVRARNDSRRLTR